ncbi:MAG: c-type cytochrome [Proteobacteria bacterium]|uniref:c-type cytochrome n=1 Tax=Rudaea sp. TaxID=2136325 RepID=UPI00321FC391|nr:c-type cytochrome [Pseudomonadota bacterium]
MKLRQVLLAATLAAVATANIAANAAEAPGALAQRGRYLVRTSGCNDCHTPGYAQSGGEVDEKLWLTGDALGWQGPWGTTYATNLRLLLAAMSERQWLVHARTMQPRPPMPWFNVRAMNDDDLKAIYAFVKKLGPAGSPAPAYVPPGKEAAGPVVRFP